EDVLRKIGRRAVRRHLDRALRINLRGELFGVVLGNESARNGDEIGVAEPKRAVGEREFERLADDVRRSDWVFLLSGLEVERFQNVENLREVNAARARRREAVNLVAAIR